MAVLGQGSAGKGFAGDKTRTAVELGMQQVVEEVTGTEGELAPELRVGRTSPRERTAGQENHRFQMQIGAGSYFCLRRFPINGAS